MNYKFRSKDSELVFSSPIPQQKALMRVSKPGKVAVTTARLRCVTIRTAHCAESKPVDKLASGYPRGYQVSANQ
jgi:hypothetical protein